MSKLEKYIRAPEGNLDEMTYEGNIGFAEMVEFYKSASNMDISRMEEVVRKEDWEGFKKLIRKVTGTQLK
jgi:enolase